MKKFSALLFLLITASVACAQKIINDPNAEVRKVAPFSGIKVSGGIDVYVSAGDEAIAVSASKQEHKDRIRTEVENGVLKIWYDGSQGMNIRGAKNLKAYVSYKTIKSLEVSGGSDINVDGTITTNDLSLRASGGSDFRGSVNTSNLTVRLSGGSDVHISGRASALVVDASGGSDFKGYDLQAEVCDLEASGASDIELTATKELSARASGASDIRYRGTPSVKEARSSQASSVSAKS